MFAASGFFDSIDCQIEGLGRIEAVENLYVQHTQNAIEAEGIEAAEASDRYFRPPAGVHSDQKGQR